MFDFLEGSLESMDDIPTIADTFGSRLREVSAGGMITTEPRASVALGNTNAVALDASGNVWLVENGYCFEVLGNVL